MTYITSTSSFQPAVNDRTLDHPNHSYSQGSTDVRQNCSPLVPIYYLDSQILLHDPLHHTHVVPIPSIRTAESEHYALDDPRDMSVPSPNNLNLLPEQSIAPVSSFAGAGPPYDIPYANQSHLHQADETMPEALPAPLPSGRPYSSAPLTTQRPRSLPEPTNVPLNAAHASDQSHIQAAIHPPTSTTSHEFGGNAVVLSAPPVPLAAANPTTDHSNAVHRCQCVTGGSPCNTAVVGSARSVRDHLKRVHGFRGAGKDMVECLWAGCEKRLQRGNIPRHIVTCHLHVKVCCVGCGLPLSRRDVQYSHAKVCRAGRQIASRLDSDVSSANSRLSI